MLKRTTVSLLLSVGASLSAWSQLQPASAQALLPYTLPLDRARLQADGESLATDAAQLAQFRQFDEALARAQLAAQLLPGNPDVLTLLGSLYLQATDRQPEQAVATLEQAKTLQPDNAAIAFTLGSAYFMQQDYNQAVKSIEAGLKIEPENPDAMFDLGNAYFKLGQYDKAIAQYEKAVKKESSFWPAVNNIGLVKYEAGDTAGAIAEWQRALDIAAEDQTEPQLAIAVAQFAQGGQAANSETAIAALERNPNYADIEFLQENLWGNRLVADTQQFFNTPALRELLIQLTPKDVDQTQP